MCVCVRAAGGLKVTCEYLAQQEGVLWEEVQLLSKTNEDVCVKVKVHARVMGEILNINNSLTARCFSVVTGGQVNFQGSDSVGVDGPPPPAGESVTGSSHLQSRGGAHRLLCPERFQDHVCPVC